MPAVFTSLQVPTDSSVLAQDPNRTTFQKEALSADPAGSSESEAGVMYKCRKCRYVWIGH